MKHIILKSVLITIFLGMLNSLSAVENLLTEEQEILENLKSKLKEEEPYERFISLGSNCTAKYQISRHLVNKYYKTVEDPNQAKDLFQKHKELGGAYPFDWMEIHDYELFLKKDNLSPGPCCFTDKLYNIGLHHLFSRDEHFKVTPRYRR